MKNGPKYIYISDPLFQTVKDSQVLNWLELFAKKGVSFDLLLVTRLSYLLKNNALRKQKLMKARAIVTGKVRQVFMIKSNDATGLSDAIVACYLLWLLFPSCVIRKRKVVIQTRLVGMAVILRFLARICKNMKVIFDYRGAGGEEYINGLGYSDIGKVSDPVIKKKYAKEILRQQRMLNFADYVFCVSNRLKQYAINLLKERGAENRKILVIPGSADENQFFLDRAIRGKIRKAYGVEKRFVLIYTGKLDLHWQKKEAVFQLAAGLMRIHPFFFFMCLTPEMDLARRLAENSGIDGKSLLIKYADYSDIPEYLNAADAGIILRDDNMTNHVASPTKIPEYLLCGLPVVISRNVGDFSEFIEKNDLGIVLDENPAIDLVANRLLSDPFDRDKIAACGRNFYAKQRVIGQILNVYTELAAE